MFGLKDKDTYCCVGWPWQMYSMKLAHECLKNRSRTNS